MKRIFVPTTSPDDWRQFLAEPDKQWRSGYSAKNLAVSWEQAKGFPSEFQNVLSRAGNPALRDLELLLAIPEYQVDLPGGRSPSQNDLFILARAKDEQLVSITVEGKVSEPFGKPLAVWLKNASEGKRIRLQYLCEVLGLPDNLPLNIRYQLLHRTASAIIEARRFNARYAMMIVHSFSQEHKGFEDYQTFLSLFGASSPLNEIVELQEQNNLRIYAGWVSSKTQTG